MSKVLVVDDQYDNVRLLAYELMDHGYEVLTAFNGPQALEVARSAGPDVILLDVMMPGMNGVEVCRELKNDANLRSIPVIMVSAREMDEDVIRGLDAGAHDYVTKPFNARIVMARVRSAARAKEAHDLIADMNQRLAELATTDGLTGVKNHRHFREALDTAVALATRKGVPLSVIMLDVDHFKSINDTHGHAVGDDVLCSIAQTLQSHVRQYDVVARYGGEEFAILLPMTESTASRAVAERLRETVAQYPWRVCHVTISLGVATMQNPGSQVVKLVEEADVALYQSKRNGRNRVTHHDDLALESANGLGHQPDANGGQTVRMLACPRVADVTAESACGQSFGD
jgi:two-component system, cell cycle response regulator